MRWREGRRSENVEDRRGMSRAAVGGIGGLGLLVVVVVAMLFGVDPRQLLDQVGSGAPPSSSVDVPAWPPGAQDELGNFVSVVLADTEDTWTEIFSAAGRSYEQPRLVLFSGMTESACGLGQAAMGPFYCPEDHRLYIDLEFYRELRDRFSAPGDFAQAYVIAHEVGHHVQNLLGIADQVASMQAQGGERQAAGLSVRMELQADCLAGVWANHADRVRGILEPGDIDEALNAAAAIGDDRMQRQTQGYAVPDSFTHGSSEQRVRWFRTGFTTGEFNACDTFGAPTL